MDKCVKQILCYILFALICITIVGCSQEKEDENLEIDKNKNKWESEILDENLQANFEADTSNIIEAFLYKCELSAIAIDEIKNTFFSSDSSATELSSREAEVGLPQYGTMYFLTSENGLYIHASCLGARGETSEADFYRNFLACDRDAWDINARPAKLGTDEEISYLDKAQIQNEIVDGLGKLLPNVNVAELKFYALTADYLTRIQNAELERLKAEEDLSWYEKEKRMAKEWQKEEGAYYITVEMSLDQIPFNDALNQGFTDGRKINSYTATFIYNNKGCVYVEFPEIWNVNSKESKKILTVAEALEALKEDMSLVILTNENIIEDAELRYCVMPVSASVEFEIRPIWIFHNRMTIEGVNSKGEAISEVYEENYYVDACTGEVLH